jgi:hypothetical protein
MQHVTIFNRVLAASKSCKACDDDNCIEKDKKKLIFGD